MIQFCEKTKPFEEKKGLHLKAVRDIGTKYWQAPVYAKEIDEFQENNQRLNDTFNNENTELKIDNQDKYVQNVGQLVSVTNKINYL